MGGSLQLLVELQYLEAAMPAALSFPAASEALDHLKDIMSQLLEACPARAFLCCMLLESTGIYRLDRDSSS